MGSLSRLQRRAMTIDPKHPGDPALAELFGGSRSIAGPSVTATSAMGLPMWYACIRNISEDTAGLPLFLYRRRGDDDRERATKHSLYPVLHDLANPLMDAFQFRRTLTAHVLGWGMGYAEIEFDEGGRVVGLWPLLPDRTSLENTPNGLVVKTTIDGKGHVLPAAKVFILTGFTFNGMVGYSPVALHRETIGRGLAQAEYNSRLIGSDVRPSLVVTYKGELDEDARKEAAKDWQDNFGGLDKRQRIAVLKEGTTVVPVGFSPEDAQYIETTHLTGLDLCRIFRMPPHKVQDLLRATYSNISHQAQEYWCDTLRPWLNVWESAISHRLLTAAEREIYYAEHELAALLTADPETRWNIHRVAHEQGVSTSNDIARRENMPKVPKEQGGDTHFVNNALRPVKEILSGRPAADLARRAILEREAARALKREEQDILALARKHGADGSLAERVSTYYIEHAARAAAGLRPVIEDLAALIGGDASPIVSTLETRVLLQKGGVLACIDGPNLAALQTLYEGRRATWPSSFADSILREITPLPGGSTP